MAEVLLQIPKGEAEIHAAFIATKLAKAGSIPEQYFEKPISPKLLH